MPVPDGGSLAVSFVVVNKGGWTSAGVWSSDAINALELAGSAVLGALVQGTIVAPASTTAATTTTAAVTTTTATVTLPWVIGIGAAIIAALEAINILFADCDGTVVPGVLSLGETELLQYASTGSWNIIYDYPGTNSPDGCGANSDYTVTYNVKATPPAHPMTTVPDVTGTGPILASKILVESGLVAHFSGPNTAKSWVFSQSPSAGAEVVPGSVVNMVLSTLTQK
jgi:hypothetical protein